ncbi:MAG: hypothetical protein L6Q78_04950 [Bacteroidia bacterium]|nr:hypothetical protein [Bacteroidia bacterium]
MKKRNKAKVASTILVVIYLFLAFVVNEYFAITKIDWLVNFPFTIALALTYAYGGLIGLLFYVCFLTLLWFVFYFIQISIISKRYNLEEN